MKFRLIPPGEFLMGSTPREIDETISRLIPDDKTGPAFCRSESPQHKVVLTKPFYVGNYEVTQQEYETVLGTNPSQFSANGPRKDAVAGMDTGKHPVELVQWRDAADFCAKLSAKEKLQPCYFTNGLEVTVLEGRNGYRFPTEAQWEFACRAGTTTKYWNGDTDEGLVQIGWFNRNSGDRTHAVGELNANPFGLYDVHGNVREYCQDWFDEEFYKTFQDKEAIDPLGPARTSTSDHLVRGGGSQNNPTICRSASRHTAGGVAPGHVHTGFRVVLSVDAVRQTLASGNLAGDLDREVAWWVLAGGGHGEIKADVEGVNSTFDTTEQLPNKPFAITDLYIHRKTVKAQDLEKLTGLSHLIRLRYVGVTMGDNLTRLIEGLTNLTYLQLNQCGLTDVGVERLGKLSKLEYLDLNWQPGITDRGLAVVQRMPRLGYLGLSSTSVTDKGLTYLRQLPIGGLFMTGTKVTDAGMTTLAEVRSLEQLDLSVTSIGDEGVAQLASLPKLRMLALQKTALTDRGLKHLATVRSLQTLHVGGTKVTADGIASLRKALPNCKITDEPLPSEPSKPTVVATAPSASPWDLLDPTQIPEAERVPRQPEGLVAVLGQHRRRVWNIIRSTSASPDGTQFTLTTDDGLYLFGRDPKQQTRFFTFAGRISSATFLPDGRIAAFVAEGGSLALHIFAKPGDDAPLEKQSTTNTNNVSGIVHPMASSDGRWLAAHQEPNNFTLWRLSDAAPQRVASFAIPEPHGGIRPGSFSPDSKWFCFTDENAASSAAHLIDLRGDTPREATVLKADADEKSDAPAKGFWDAVFLSDGRLATADKNGRTWFWKLNDGEPQRVGSIPDSGVLCAATDALRLFMYDSKGIWDLSVDPPKQLGTCPGSFALDNIQSMVFSPDGTTFLTAHLNGAVRFWNVSPTGVSEADPLQPNPGQFAIEPFRIVDDLLCTTKEFAPIYVGMWRPTRNGMQALPDLTDATAVLDSSPARKLLVLRQPSALGAIVLRRDGDRWTPIRRIPGTNTDTAAMDNSGQRLAIRSDSGPVSGVELWGWEADDLPANKLSSVNVPERALQLAFAEAGRTLIGRLGGFQIQIWDVKEDQLIPRTKLPPRQFNQFAVAPDGNSLATVSHGGVLELWNLKSDLTQPTTSFSFSGPFAVAFSPDGRRLAASFWENGASAGVQIINLTTGVVEKRLTFPGRVHELTFTDDSRHLITGNANATIYVVRLEERKPLNAAKTSNEKFAQWMKQVASRSADGQVVEVVKKLRELNPEFDGEFSHKVEKGAVTELLITNAHIVDISPIRALPELKSLRLAGRASPNPIGQLIDLSPLAGMKLTSLDCSFTRVKDLSPLKGMKLTQLNCRGTKVDDLSPLAQMPLTDLNCGSTGISDLSPLKGMPLTKLDINTTNKITDLTALKGLPLTELVFFHNFRVTDLSPLEGMKLTVLDCFTTGVTDLSPLKGMPLTFLQCANTKVSDLSPLEGMPLTGLYCFSTQVEDLSPLKGMPLKSLLCNRTRVHDAALKHLSGLSELEKLDLTATQVTAAGIATLQKALPNCKITVELSPADRPK